MKKHISGFILILGCIITSSNTYAQKVDNNKLEHTVGIAYKRAYAACVQLYAYDTVARQQAGGVFSGVVVSKDGYIYTAAHVTTPGVIYRVSFPDGKTCLAIGLGKIELANDKTIPDVAMIKIISQGTWPFAVTGSSASLKVNEPCISIAYPESLGQPKPILRFGYISNVKNERGFIKSTCLMEPGDSGGPLFDYMGRLIGLHSAIEVPEEDNYDVPVDLYKKYATALKIPKVYTAYPDQEDAVPADSLAESIISIPGLINNKGFSAATTKFNNTCLVVVSNVQGKSQRINGTLFSFRDAKLRQGIGQSLIVSKSSMVGDQPQIICADHHKVAAKVIARDKEDDLVLLEPVEALKGGISYKQLTDTNREVVNAGVFLVSPRQDTTGTISISGSPVFPLRKMSSLGFLGVGFKGRNAPLKVSYVFPNLNKSVYQIKIGDEITSINGNAPQNFDDYAKELSRFWPGDTIKLQIKRGDSSLTQSIMLDTLPQRHFNHPAEMFAGGKSGRRDGFNTVFTHDAILKPENCGGPVFDLKGDFYGINIARFSRTSCLAIPAEAIFNFINKAVLVAGN
jgi:serine protease Do